MKGTLILACAALLVAYGGSWHAINAGKYQEDSLLAETTLVKRGEFTAEQRTRGRIIEDIYVADSGTDDPSSSLVEAAKRSPGTVTTVFDQGLFPFGDRPDLRDPRAALDELVRTSDLVVVGHATSKVSQLTEDERTIFTDYQVRIDQILKSPADLERGSMVTVTRPGGSIEIDGLKTYVLFREYLPLHVRTGQYLLFLKYHPEADSFTSVNCVSTYEVGGTKVRLLATGAYGESIDHLTSVPSELLRRVESRAKAIQ